MALPFLMQGNRDWPKNLGEQILSLSSTDKQHLVESMISDRIPVILEREENGGEHWAINHKLACNIIILQDLSEEGRLASIDPR